MSVYVAFPYPRSSLYPRVLNCKTSSLISSFWSEKMSGENVDMSDESAVSEISLWQQLTARVMLFSQLHFAYWGSSCHQILTTTVQLKGSVKTTTSNLGVDALHETYQESARKRISLCFYLLVGLSYWTYLIHDNFTDVSLFSSYYNALPKIVTAPLNYYWIDRCFRGVKQ